MEVVLCPDGTNVAQRAADMVVEALDGVHYPVIGLATGSSPLKLYQALASRVDDGTFDVSRLQAFALDEYVGLDPTHQQSYAHTIDTVFTRVLGVNPHSVHVPNGMAEDLVAACAAYEQAILAAGGVDVQILGIGSNGHIGFNEPSSSFASRTRIKTLTAQTRADNARFFGPDETVPTHCVTQGLGTIMDAYRLIMVAQGEGKANAVAAMVEGPVSAMCPASILQFHPRASVVIDEAAASKLQLASYYREVFSSKMEIFGGLVGAWAPV